jgi:hypothetical protein
LPVGIISSDVGLKKLQTLSAISSPSMTSEILQSVSGEFPLSWSHYVRLLALDEQAKRDFYEEEGRRTGWSVRQLDRQINSMLYERVALSTLLLILCSEKDEAVAHYALGKLTNKVFASRYKLQLPDPQILTREVEAERRRLEMRSQNK